MDVEKSRLPGWWVLVVVRAGCAGTGGERGGQLRFEGFGRVGLGDFAVVPEDDDVVVRARDGGNGAVDGFFWRYGKPGWWFKIPDHCAVVVRRDGGGEEGGEFEWEQVADPAGVVLQRVRGMPERAGWYLDRGVTGHPVDSPFE